MGLARVFHELLSRDRLEISDFGSRIFERRLKTWFNCISKSALRIPKSERGRSKWLMKHPG